MTSVWAVTRKTFIQSLRSKVGLVAMVLLGVLLVATPMLVNNASSPLADRIRTFLSYSVGLTGMILAVITVFLSTTFICSEVQRKQIFLLAVKPLARWEYILGRWLGVVLLDALLLLCAGAGIYGGAQYLRSQADLGPKDRRAVETEIFTARRKITPDYSRDESLVDERITARVEAARRAGKLEEMIAGFLPAAQNDRDKAMNLIAAEFQRQERERLQSVPPGQFSRPYIFRNVHVQGVTRNVSGKVERVQGERFLVELQLDRSVASELMPGRPLDLNGALSRILYVGETTVIVQVTKDPFFSKGINSLKAGDGVQLTLEPAMELAYKLSPGQAPPNGGTLGTSWAIGPENAQSSQRVYDAIDQDDLPNLPVFVTTSGRCVDDNGNVVAQYLNKNGTSISIAPGDVSLLYTVGGFEANFLRALGMLLVRLMFIAALGVLAASFLSFPVAVLFTLVLMLFSLATGYVVEAAKYLPDDPVSVVMQAVVKVLSFLLPDLSTISPTDAIVGGVEIQFFTSWSIPLVLGGTAVIMAIACVIFTKRELARVQV